ncbi:alpha/beta fold hydrolase [Streptomyces sp. NPDC048434]|uniref:alpha/beta fold hydrolase n=1 Tax=Streptomyces sp. NPDC048434 TaxID=3365549 RepID=UPI00371BB9A5
MALIEAQQHGLVANRAALRGYGREPSMTDPTLLGRLGAIALSTLVLWGESDGVVDADYGRAYAGAIPGARFQLLAGAGHVPQSETPEQLMLPIRDFADAPATHRPTAGGAPQELRV